MKKQIVLNEEDTETIYEIMEGYFGSLRVDTAYFASTHPEF